MYPPLVYDCVDQSYLSIPSALTMREMSLSLPLIYSPPFIDSVVQFQYPCSQLYLPKYNSSAVSFV